MCFILELAWINKKDIHLVPFLPTNIWLYSYKLNNNSILVSPVGRLDRNAKLWCHIPWWHFQGCKGLGWSRVARAQLLNVPKYFCGLWMCTFVFQSGHTLPFSPGCLSWGWLCMCGKTLLAHCLCFVKFTVSLSQLCWLGSQEACSALVCASPCLCCLWWPCWAFQVSVWVMLAMQTASLFLWCYPVDSTLTNLWLLFSLFLFFC